MAGISPLVWALAQQLLADPLLLHLLRLPVQLDWRVILPPLRRMVAVSVGPWAMDLHLSARGWERA